MKKHIFITVVLFCAFFLSAQEHIKTQITYRHSFEIENDEINELAK